MPLGLDHRRDASPIWTELLERALDPDYNAETERVFVFHREALNVNCNQHIQQRFKPDEIESVTAIFMERARELKQENASLRSIEKGRSGLETFKKESRGMVLKTR